MRVERCAPEPYLGSLMIVEGPITFWICAAEGTLGRCPRQTRSRHFGLWRGAG
jgi:hypothetical protein